jgi:hypothetical protein
MRIFPLFILIISLWAPSARAQPRQEFNGPFAGWADLKVQFGAKGNGTDDDTRAFQAAIDGLSNPVTGFIRGKPVYMVIYLPAGTYCLSSTLLLKGKIGVSIIGEDPLHTFIKWIGADKDTMLWADGSSYFKIARISWDANGRKDMEGIGIHWKDRWRLANSMSFAPLNIEISDCYFTGAFRFGISGGTTGANGTTGNNDSEITIRRCQFSNCTGSGIQIQGYNALDYWIWDCRFEDCFSGVTCMFGNYHVYRSFFSGSASADVDNTNGYYTSLRGCFSEHSRRFSADEGKSSNPFKRIFQDNTVIDPAEAPIQYHHTGKLSLWGNKFSRQSDTIGFPYSIYYNSWAVSNYEVLTLHNVYTRREPFQYGGGGGYGKIYAFGDQVLPNIRLKADRQAFLQAMDPLPPNRTRKIFEVPPGAGADAIQAVLNEAAALKGQRPIVHFPVGSWYIDKSLLIPPGADMQITGDGLVYSSVIVVNPGAALKGPAFNGAAFNGPAFLVEGPSFITVRDLQINGQPGKKTSTGILFEGVDQPGAQAYLDQVYSQADTSLYVSDLDYLYIQKDNSFFNAGNYVSGGPLVSQHKGTARVACFGGQFARLTVMHNARFLAKDCWWEGPERCPLNLSGSGSVTLDGAMIAPAEHDSMTTIRIGKFDGQISMMNMYLQGGLSVQGDNPSLQLLVWNILFYFKLDPLDFLRDPVSYKGAFAGLNAQCFRTNDPACRNILMIGDQFRNIKDSIAFLDTQTAPDRLGVPQLYRNLPAGISNIDISRISFGPMEKGVVFRL